MPVATAKRRTTLFQTIRPSGNSSLDEHESKVDILRGDVLNAFRKSSVAAIERVQDGLCRDAQTLDPNEDLHRLLRLSRSERRVRVEGRLGAAMLILTMAELIRRTEEEAFGIEG
jgi:hypothetical protein